MKIRLALDQFSLPPSPSADFHFATLSAWQYFFPEFSTLSGQLGGGLKWTSHVSVAASLDVPPERGLVCVVLLAVSALERGRPLLPRLERDVRRRAVPPVRRLVGEGPRADLQGRFDSPISAHNSHYRTFFKK